MLGVTWEWAPFAVGVVVGVLGIIVTLLCAKVVRKRRVGRNSHEVIIKADGNSQVARNVIAGRDAAKD